MKFRTIGIAVLLWAMAISTATSHPVSNEAQNNIESLGEKVNSNTLYGESFIEKRGGKKSSTHIKIYGTTIKPSNKAIEEEDDGDDENGTPLEKRFKKTVANKKNKGKAIEDDEDGISLEKRIGRKATAHVKIYSKVNEEKEEEGALLEKRIGKKTTAHVKVYGKVNEGEMDNEGTPLEKRIGKKTTAHVKVYGKVKEGEMGNEGTSLEKRLGKKSTSHIKVYSTTINSKGKAIEEEKEGKSSLEKRLGKKSTSHVKVYSTPINS